MAKAVPLEKLGDEIQAILNFYDTRIPLELNLAVKEVARVGTNNLRMNARRKIHGKTRKYENGWKYKVEEKRLYSDAIIYQSSKPGLPHLLENTHVISNGTGRSYGETSINRGQYPHIKEIEEKIIREFGNRVRISLT